MYFQEAARKAGTYKKRAYYRFQMKLDLYRNGYQFTVKEFEVLATSATSAIKWILENEAVHPESYIMTYNQKGGQVSHWVTAGMAEANRIRMGAPTNGDLFN